MEVGFNLGLQYRRANKSYKERRQNRPSFLEKTATLYTPVKTNELGY